MVIPLAALGGISRVLDIASTHSLADHFPITVILAAALVLGSLSGIIGVNFVGGQLRLVGGWLGGVANVQQVRAAVAWGQLPSLYASLLWIPSLVLFREELYTTLTPRLDVNPALAIALISIRLVAFVCAIWSIVVSCKCLGEVHGFSAWVAFGSTILAGMLIVICVVIPLILFVVLAATLG
jgi:hypothetical protein